MQTQSPHELFLRKYVRPSQGRTLICGSRLYDGREDRRKAYNYSVGVDALEGPGVDRVFDLERSDAAAELGKFAHIECWSVLEHSKRPWLLAENLQYMLEPGGTIHLTVPFAWRLHAYPSDYFRFTPEGVKTLFPRINWARLMFAQDKLRDNGRIPVLGKGNTGPSWIAKTEVFGFGVLA